MRRFFGGGAPVALSCSHAVAPSLSSSPLLLASPLFLPAGHLAQPRRLKASFLRVANRKRVEMFLGKRFHLPTRLRTAAPEIAAEWDCEKNPMHLYPDIVGIGHVTPVWWRCAACQHSFSMSVEKRVVRGGGCPACATSSDADGSKEENGLEGGTEPEPAAQETSHV